MNCVNILFENDLLNRSTPGIIYFDSIKALSSSDKNISFKEFKILMGRAQKYAIDIGLNERDTALLFELPSPSLYAVISALLAMGVKVLLVEPWLPVNEINHIINRLSPKLFITGFSGKLFSLKVSSLRKIPYKTSSKNMVSYGLSIDPFAINVDGNHIGILTFTSGTTGKSKGVARTHQYLINQRNVISKYIDYQNLEKLDLTVFTNLTLMNLVLGKGSLILPKWKANIISDLNRLPDKYIPDTIATGPFLLSELTKLIDKNKINFNTVKVGGALSSINAMESFQNKFNPTRFIHVYGSTEAEPVAFTDMSVSIRNSKLNGDFHCTFLGKKIDEIKLQNKEVLWVSGPHVSEFYLDDEISNKKNKMQINEDIFHNMGDHIRIDDENQLWYEGRDFQLIEDFRNEQRIYVKINSAEGFITYINKQKVFVTSIQKLDLNILKEYGIEKIITVKEIYKDRRHLSRIDRFKIIEKNKLNRR